MASYYYLMSSLPMLKADGDIPFRYSTFLGMCRSSINDAEYAKLEGLSVDSSEGPLMSEWAKFYSSVAHEMTYQRNLRLGKPAEIPQDRNEDAMRIVSSVMGEKNPLEAEKKLLALEFEKLDELINMHYFDEYALVGYALKLKLLERKTVFVQEEGKAEFGRILNSLQQHILSM